MDTWKYAYEAVKIVEEFQDAGIETRIIYNWWRPEPYNGNVGLPLLKRKSDLVTISHNAVGYNYTQTVQDFRHVLNGPGEYEIGGVFITGIATHHKNKKALNVIYVFNFDYFIFRRCHKNDVVFCFFLCEEYWKN